MKSSPEELTTQPPQPAADPSHPLPARNPGGELPSNRRVDWRRIKQPMALIALIVLTIATLSQTLGTVVAGRLAEDTTATLVLILLALLLGGAALDTLGRFFWAGVVDRAEGRLRQDLLDVAMNQPLAALNEQAVGEVLDRIDDDTHEVGTLIRTQLWEVFRAATGVVPMWIIAAITWPPAWIIFPIATVATIAVMRPLLKPIAERKVIEEAAWTEHAAALEEGIAGRDDIRTSLGQPFVVGRLAKLSAKVHHLFHRVLMLELWMTLRAGVVLHLLLAVVAVAGVWLASGGSLSVGALVTLFLLTSTFVGRIYHVAENLPDLQAGLGAVQRLRQMISLPSEPEGGEALPEGALDLHFADLSFSYTEGSPVLHDVELTVPAGRTIALVGRTGSGKSTLASLVSRAVEPEPGTVLLGGTDVRDLDLEALRKAVGVVSQRTEIIAGTLAQNIDLFTDLPHQRIADAITELGLDAWVAGLPDGLDTMLGPGGTNLSAGEEQLLAFARLLVRDVKVVILDEATARIDPLTETQVINAADRLLAGRTGILVAHRLSTVARADLVAVLEQGSVIQQGPRADLSTQPGPYRDLLAAATTEGSALETATVSPSAQDGPSSEDSLPTQDSAADSSVAGPGAAGQGTVGQARRVGAVPDRAAPSDGPSLARGVWHALTIRPRWGAMAVGLFLASALLGSVGSLTGYVWGHTVAQLQRGDLQLAWVVALVVAILAGPVLLAVAISLYPRWWIEVLLRVRMAVLVGQTAQRRLPATPPGEVVARAMDADRYARYADRWVDFVNGLIIAVITAVAAGTPLAGLVLGIVMFASAAASAIGRPIAGRSAAQASTARARFGRALVSTLDSARTVKLAGRTPELRAHLSHVDSGRVRAAVREHRVQAVLDGVPTIMVQLGAVAAWAAVLLDLWGLATALLVVNAVNGFDWFGRVAGAVVTEAPGTRAWQKATSRFAGGVDLMDLDPRTDLLTGDSPPTPEQPRTSLHSLELQGLNAIHDDGTIGVEGVDLTISRGELVLLLGQVGSGKSSLLRAMAGLLDHDGSIRWNGTEVTDAETFLRPGQVAYVAQIPRVMSGTFGDNVQLGFDREFDAPVAAASLSPDVEHIGGREALVGHRGVRLSGGQVQRVALARAFAADAELLLADDVSSALDAATELELWQTLRERGATVLGASSKRAALQQADKVVVLVEGRVAAAGPWEELATDWSHLSG